jgi:hypothetical protein
MAEASKLRFPWLRDVLLLSVGIVLDRTVNYVFPSFVPVLPYAWLLILAWLTREIIARTPLRKPLVRAYSHYAGRKRLLAYLIIFAIAGALGCVYWYGINRALVKSEVLQPTPGPVEVKGRHLTEWQRGRLMSYVSAHPGTRIRILVSEGQETLAYANDFLDVFKKAGWVTEEPKAAPASLLVMDTRLAADDYKPARPEVLQLRETLKDMQIKTAKYSIMDGNIPRGWMVLWVGAESPPDWSPETVPPYAVPPDEFAQVKPDSLEGLSQFPKPDKPPEIRIVPTEELKFTTAIVSSPDSNRPFGLKIVLLTDKRVQQTRISILCDTPVDDLQWKFAWSRSQMANVIVSASHNVIQVEFDKPVWSPNKPLTISFFTTNRINVVRAFRHAIESI